MAETSEERAARGAAPGKGPPPFGVHDLLPDIILPDDEGKVAALSREMAGKKLLLLICPALSLPAAAERLAEFAAARPELEPFVHVFCITRAPPEANRAALAGAPLPFLVLSDVDGQVARGLAVAHNLETAAEGTGALTAVLADENRRILAIQRDIAGPGAPARVLERLRALPVPAPRSLGGFAPVLYVPDVIEPGLRRALIGAFEAANPGHGSIYSGANTSGEHVIDPEVKMRRDLYIRDPALLDALRLRFVRRMKPEVEKAFTREVVGVDYFRLVCYDAAESGHFRAHRDNVSEHTAHRRFAVTLNLNTGEYEGGALRFPEYGPDLYSPAAGDAVVFSCALMHEVTPVTKGRRFALIFFLFDEESRRLNERFRG